MVKLCLDTNSCHKDINRQNYTKYLICPGDAYTVKKE
jgi:hypothetical protein